MRKMRIVIDSEKELLRQQRLRRWAFGGGKTIPATEGIYFIHHRGKHPWLGWYGDKPIYIGETGNLHNRLSVHRSTIARCQELDLRDFQFSFMPTPASKKLEDLFIEHYDPWWNRKELAGFGNDRSARQSRTASVWESLFVPSGIPPEVSLRWETQDGKQKAVEALIAAYQQERHGANLFTDFGWLQEPVVEAPKPRPEAPYNVRSVDLFALFAPENG